MFPHVSIHWIWIGYPHIFWVPGRTFGFKCFHNSVNPNLICETLKSTQKYDLFIKEHFIYFYYSLRPAEYKESVYGTVLWQLKRHQQNNKYWRGIRIKNTLYIFIPLNALFAAPFCWQTLPYSINYSKFQDHRKFYYLFERMDQI